MTHQDTRQAKGIGIGEVRTRTGGRGGEGMFTNRGPLDGEKIATRLGNPQQTYDNCRPCDRT